MKFYYVYILECNDKYKSFYTGYTDDVEKRVKTHNAGKGSKFTRCRLPVRLLLTIRCQSKSQALKKEYVIKQMSRAEKEKLTNVAKPSERQ